MGRYNIFLMLDKLIKLLPTRPVYAHCDLPCGIYDPHMAQLAAHTVIRMTNFLKELHASSDNAPFEERKKIIHDISRVTKVKEEHGEICKREITTLWGDYFKEEHLKDYPELHDLIWKTLKLASKAKQTIDLENANALLENTQKIAEIFWKTKGMEPVRVPSGYPTEGEIITHK
jgi:nickel superoxide dismutase